MLNKNSFQLLVFPHWRDSPLCVNHFNCFLVYSVGFSVFFSLFQWNIEACKKDQVSCRKEIKCLSRVHTGVGVHSLEIPVPDSGSIFLIQARGALWGKKKKNYHWSIGLPNGFWFSEQWWPAFEFLLQMRLMEFEI